VPPAQGGVPARVRCLAFQRLLPISDLSSQISTGGYEASGTSDMKFMMNGAVNRDPRRANIEIGQEAGDENFFLFDLTPNRGRQPGVVQPLLALQPRTGHASGARPDPLGSLQLQRAGCLRSLRDTLLTQGDH
jgi:glycogen phosphorylase